MWTPQKRVQNVCMCKHLRVKEMAVLQSFSPAFWSREEEQSLNLSDRISILTPDEITEDAHG